MIDIEPQYFPFVGTLLSIPSWYGTSWVVEGIFALGTIFHDDVATEGTESVGRDVVSTTVSVVAIESVTAVVSDDKESDDDESDEHDPSASAAMTIAILRMAQS